ncbi:MAG: RluA family pseudouridine synthase [Planctomycetota bacterium]|jgi:23S rRNA pseudouridine1911/1915/1917 synthase|nr:RluA family pseudouridine synthase [Planctomycetota bacterium]
MDSARDDAETGRLVVMIPPDLDGERLDKALVRLFPEHSRVFWQKAADAGLAILGNGDAGKPGRRVQAGERILLAPFRPAATTAKPESIPLSILYEDDDVVVVNKPSGMVTHPSPGHGGGTLVNALLHHCGSGLAGAEETIRPGIVHRLDRDTSGCLAAAKNDRAHRSLVRQFTERRVEKIYLAITDGVPRPQEGRVEASIGRHPTNRKFHAVLASGGRHSLTLYRTVENYGVIALVECNLKTGRTHQARVHLASLGAPILCDCDYGRRREFTRADIGAAIGMYRRGKPAWPDAAGMETGAVPILSRQALHAWRLSFNHPATGERLRFKAPVPTDMLAVLAPFRAARKEMEGSDRPA